MKMSIHLILAFVFVFMHGAVGKLSLCKNGWIAYEGSCYWIAKDQQDFTEAEHYCRQHDSHLLEINDSIENAFIKERFRERNGQCYWLGISDELIESVWIWQNSQTYLNFTDWYPGQPGHDGEQDCAIMYRSHDYKWDDYPCSYKCAAACKRSGYSCDGSEIIG